MDLNHRPLPYQGSALTRLSYRPVKSVFTLITEAQGYPELPVSPNSGELYTSLAGISSSLFLVTESRCAPSSRFTKRTPIESRPVWRTSAAGVLITVPADVIARTSSSFCNTSALTSEPRESSSIFAALIPMPPRPCKRYSSIGVFFP